jgi:hypothetical protein
MPILAAGSTHHSPNFEPTLSLANPQHLSLLSSGSLQCSLKFSWGLPDTMGPHKW